MTMMDTDSLITRANEEREKIFLKYERGREAGAEIDSWEDFTVYEKTDRYARQQPQLRYHIIIILKYRIHSIVNHHSRPRQHCQKQ